MYFCLSSAQNSGTAENILLFCHVEDIRLNFRKMKALNINESSVFYSFIRSTVAVVNAIKEITKDF